jgi:hypothetical protein
MKKERKVEEKEEPEPMPRITPEMIQSARRILEAEGMIYYKKGGIYVPTEKGWKLLMEIRPIKEEIIAWGDEKILATDTEKLGITKSSDIKNYTIGIKANKACNDLSEELKEALKQAKKIEIFIEADGIKDKIVAFGSPALKLTSEDEIVIRKDDFIDDSTLAILADKSVSEINKELIKKNRNPKTEIKITIEVKG